jgi:hypothetical protein
MPRLFNLLRSGRLQVPCHWEPLKPGGIKSG